MDSLTIKKRFDALITQRKTLDSTLQIIERYVVPHRGEFFKPMQSEHEVDWRRREIYDSTAVDANETLSTTMQGSLTSPYTSWFTLSYRNSEMNEDQDAAEWLEECSLKMKEALNDSNFDLESAEFYLDLTSFGTAVIFEEAESEDPKKWEGLDFQAAPVRDCYFEMGKKNQINKFYRRFTWTALQCQDKFGDDTPQTVMDALDRPDSNDQKFVIIFCIFARIDKKHNMNSSGLLSAEERPYGYKWVLHKDGEQIGEEGGYYDQPAFVARWRKTSGSQWGYSPAHIALSDILTLNQLTEETLEALGKVVDPATLVTERNLMSDLELGRGSLTVVRDIEGIKVHETRAKFDVGELKIDRLQSSINRAWRIDQLQMKDSPEMSATEASIRYELMQRLLGPTLGRLKNDFLDPFINRTFNIMFRAGQFPEMPPIVAENKAKLDIEYTGPMATAQRQAAVQATNQWVANTSGIAEVAPEIMDIPDFDMIARDTARMSGLPAKYLRSKNEVISIRKKRQETEQQKQEAEIAQAQGDAMKAQGEGQAAMNPTGEQQNVEQLRSQG